MLTLKQWIWIRIFISFFFFATSICLMEQAYQPSFTLINLIRKKHFPPPYYFMPCLWLQHPLYRFKDNLFFIALESFWESICVFPNIKMSPCNTMNIKQVLEWEWIGVLWPDSSIYCSGIGRAEVPVLSGPGCGATHPNYFTKWPISRWWWCEVPSVLLS